jgi:hypothetical protein
MRVGASRYLASELLLPPIETADAGHAAAAAAGAAAAACSLGGAAAAAAGATGTARSIASAAVAAAGAAAAAAGISAAATARILRDKLSDRTFCRYRVSVCRGVRRRRDRRRSHPRHEQRSHEFQFRHHASPVPLSCERKPPNFRANLMSQLSCGITTAARLGFESLRARAVMCQDIRIALNLRFGSGLFLWAPAGDVSGLVVPGGARWLAGG